MTRTSCILLSADISILMDDSCQVTSITKKGRCLGHYIVGRSEQIWNLIYDGEHAAMWPKRWTPPSGQGNLFQFLTQKVKNIIKGERVRRSGDRLKELYDDCTDLGLDCV